MPAVTSFWRAPAGRGDGSCSGRRRERRERLLELSEHLGSRDPELRDDYFGNYTRLVYLSQSLDAGLVDAARRAADRLMLAFRHVHCGYGELESELGRRLSRRDDDQEDLRLLA